MTGNKKKVNAKFKHEGTKTTEANVWGSVQNRNGLERNDSTRGDANVENTKM